MAAARSTAIVPRRRRQARYPEALLHKRHEMRLPGKKTVTIGAAAPASRGMPSRAAGAPRRARADSRNAGRVGKNRAFPGFFAATGGNGA